MNFEPRYPGLAAVLALVLLSGCSAGNGDFGRVRPSLQRDDMHAWMGEVAAPPYNVPAWRPQLTDEERRLRDLAFPLIEPPYDRNQWYSVINEYGAGTRPLPYPPPGDYATRLFQTAYRSQTARYNKLIEDIRNDVNRLDPYFQTARYVSDMDQKRSQSLAYVSNLSNEEKANAIQRMRENDAVMRWVNGTLHERVASYKIALERLVIMAPSQSAVEAERTLGLLQQRISAYGA